MSRSRFLGLFALPVLVASATAFPLDVSSDFDAAIDLWSRGRKQEALDAMRRMLAYGFERCYKDKRFKDILTIASKLHPSILENSGELADFVEAAEIQTDGLA